MRYISMALLMSIELTASENGETPLLDQAARKLAASFLMTVYQRAKNEIF